MQFQNRFSHIKEKNSKFDFKKDQNGNYILLVGKKKFILDSRGMKFFIERFDNNEFKIIAEGDHLARKNVRSKKIGIEYFDRAYINEHQNIPLDQSLIVNHEDSDEKNNTWDNLAVMARS